MLHHAVGLVDFTPTSFHATPLPASLHLVAPAGDQLALIEFASAEQTSTALSLNGMKLGDTHMLQVGYGVYALCMVHCVSASCIP
jgi:hypothetical protein